LPDYVKLIDKVPPEIQITFAGFAEPFLNPNCAAMICHAHATGHKVSLFTTGMGMSLADFEQIKGIPFTGVQGGFVLHLPDVEGYFSHHSDKYTQLLTAIKRESRHIENFRSMTMGTLSPALRGLFPETIRPAMYNRAGNVKKTEFIQISLNTTEMRNSDTTCGCPERLYHSVLLPNGDVSLCCMDYGLEHILGNLYKHSFEEIVPKDGTPFVLCKTCENGVPA
jgi:MoaA/NifB/PqqE/SkfB family radical SAM enzyme